MSPKRIQRKRTPGWRMPKGAVYEQATMREMTRARIARRRAQRSVAQGDEQAARVLREGSDKFWRKQNRYPKFKKKGKSRDSATYFRNCFTFRDGRLKLAKQSEPLDIRWSRPLPDGNADPQRTRAASEVTA